MLIHLYFLLLLFSFGKSQDLSKSRFCIGLKNILQYGDDAIQNESYDMFFEEYSLLRSPEDLEKIYLKLCIHPTQSPTLHHERDMIMTILEKIQDDVRRIFSGAWCFFKCNRNVNPSLRQTSSSDSWNYIK